MKNSLIISLILIIALLVILFIFYGSKLISIFSSNGADTNSSEKKNISGDLPMAMVQLKDAEKELIMLQELVQDQEQAAKIEILLEKVNFYKIEFQKPDQKNIEQTLEDFYSSGLWEGISDLKNKFESAEQFNDGVPELE